jgi:hypothetical protein
LWILTGMSTKLGCCEMTDDEEEEFAEVCRLIYKSARTNLLVSMLVIVACILNVAVLIWGG